MLGIVLDWTDRPIASFLVPANTADVTLLLPVVKRLRGLFVLRQHQNRYSPGCVALAQSVAVEMPSKPRRRCSPPARFSTRPTPGSVATSAGPSSPSLVGVRLYGQ
jgi:hypothetical protein